MPSRLQRPHRSLLLVLVAGILLAAAPRGSGAQEPVELRVLAAASLTDVLPQVARAWTEAGGLPVRFSFDATSRLATQAVEGAPADLFFSADHAWMAWLVERGRVDPSAVVDFLGNELVLVVPRGRPAPARPESLGVERLGLAGENVPAGRYAHEALQHAGAWPRIEARVVRAGSVRGVLEWVARGEVDAGVVYRTDALTEPRVEVAFAFDAGSHRPVRYPVAVLRGAPSPEAAAAFLAFAAGPAGQALFEAAGFRVGAAEGGPAPENAPALVPRPASALRLSLIVALVAALAGLPVAVGMGWLLARREFPGKTVVTTAVFAPLVVPPVVTGFILLSLLGAQSPLGRLLGEVGLPVPFTLLGAIVAALVVGLPLYVLSVRGAFEAVDPRYEEVSWTLGVPPRRTFLRVSLPLALPGIAAGAVLAFARALGEFGATVVLAGNVEGETRTLALAVYALLEAPSGRTEMWTLVGASLALSLAALLGFESLMRRQRRRLEVHGEE